MRKHLLLLALTMSSVFTFAQQKVYESRKEAEAAITGNEFKTSTGWVIKQGDEITLGKGSMPSKTFAFVTEMPNMLTYNQYAYYDNHKLQHTYNGRQAIIADLLVMGNKKSGFWISAKLKVGQLSRYVMDIENALEAGEVAIPKEFAKIETVTETKATSTTSIADELKKLKDLHDAGALTKEEYDAAKKKLLEKM